MSDLQIGKVELVRYLHQEFPATKGHKPLDKLICDHQSQLDRAIRLEKLVDKLPALLNRLAYDYVFECEAGSLNHCKEFIELLQLGKEIENLK